LNDRSRSHRYQVLLAPRDDMSRGSRDDGVVDAISHQLASGIDAQVQRFSFLSRVIQFQPPKRIWYFF
jgi:hypothetical protein